MSAGQDSTMIRPFDDEGVERRSDGSLGYTNLPRSLVHMFDESCRRFAEAEAIAVVGGERCSYRDLWSRASRVAGGLRDDGVERGDRVAILLPNGIEWVLAFWGVQLAGAVVVPVNGRFAPAEVDYVLSDSGSEVVIADSTRLPDGEPVADLTMGPSDLAAIFYTSGTTGFPKGAMTTHENFLSNIETCIRCSPLDPDRPPRNLVSVPLFHVTGCNSQLLPTNKLGGLTVIMPEFDVQLFLRTAVDEQIDTMITVPAIYWLAMNQPNIDEFDLD
ncbi:MAG: class I adenylate-forming enzyme family protein, partial [Acidimicrobiales bacterium]